MDAWEGWQRNSFTVACEPVWTKYLYLFCPFAADTTRALGLLEEYCTKLKQPEEQQLKTAIQRVMGIFHSNLFGALLGK